MKERIYRIATKAFLVVKYMILYIRRFLIQSNINRAECGWRISRNRNFYNPILKATVYKYGNSWKIARNGDHFGAFEFKDEAMNKVFKIWLEETNLNKTINQMDYELNNIKHKILAGSNEYGDSTYTASLPGEEEENIEAEGNLKADYFHLAQAYTNCYKCNRSILVNAIILPEGFETIDNELLDELESKGISVENYRPFCKQGYSSILSYVTYISPEALKEIYNYVSPGLFQPKHSVSTNHSYYRSICNHCGAAQGDNYIISEYNSPLLPVNIDDFNKIKFHTIMQKIQVSASSYSVGYGYRGRNSIVVTNVLKSN